MVLLPLTDPGLTNRIFDAFNCRQIGTDASVLVVDYDIDCESQHYFEVKVICIMLMLVWAVGIPLGLLWRMYLIKDLIPPDEVKVVRSLSNIGPFSTCKAPTAAEQKKKKKK